MTSPKAASPTLIIETRALRLSAWGYVFMAALGLTFAVIARSEAIMLDGIYSLISFIMTLAAGRVSRLIESGSSEWFNFGFAHFEPLLNTFRGLLILTVCLIAGVEALEALLHRGRVLSADVAVVYAGIAAGGCFLLAGFQYRASKKAASPILKVDARNWLLDGVISLGAGLAFGVAMLIRDTGLAWLLPYIDPALVLILVAVMIRVPVTTIWENFKQVLQVAPEPEVQAEVRSLISDAARLEEDWRLKVRMVHMGRFFYVLVHIIMPPETRVESVADMDAIRSRLKQSLAGFHHRPVVDTVFTADDRWTGDH